MRFFARCGICQDETEVRGLQTPEQIATLQYSFWMRHEHDPELLQHAREHAASVDSTHPANIPDFVDEDDE
jgi:hypothetical protein